MTVTAGATATFAALSELCIYSATVQAPWMPPGQSLEHVNAL